MALKEYHVEYRYKKLEVSMDSYSGHHYITEIVLKINLKISQSINQLIDQSINGPTDCLQVGLVVGQLDTVTVCQSDSQMCLTHAAYPVWSLFITNLYMIDDIIML